MSANPKHVAADYIDRWQRLWNANGEIATLYTIDSVLVAYRIALGRADIAALLRAVYDQGWTGISIRLVNVRAVGGIILLAAECVASGSGNHAGETREGKSSHVLTQADSAWLSAMHTTS
jgi:hypothetical protein